jgi:hypothetical protein
MTIYVGTRISSATGGIVTNISGYIVHTFTSSGIFIPNGTGSVEVLVVGGGGGMSGSFWAGGGGGGSVLYQKFIPVLSGVSYPIRVGLAGISNTSGTASTCTYNGGSIIAPGGTSPGLDNPLGSGGGGSSNSPATIGANVTGLGFGGGIGCPSSDSIGAGGGGAGSLGQDGQRPGVPVTPTTGKGGIGLSYSITGSPVFYGGGGSGVNTSLTASSSPTNFGLGGSGPGRITDGNPGCIIIKYIS